MTSSRRPKGMSRADWRRAHFEALTSTSQSLQRSEILYYRFTLLLFLGGGVFQAITGLEGALLAATALGLSALTSGLCLRLVGPVLRITPARPFRMGLILALLGALAAYPAGLWLEGLSWRDRSSLTLGLLMGGHLLWIGLIRSVLRSSLIWHVLSEQVHENRSPVDPNQTSGLSRAAIVDTSLLYANVLAFVLTAELASEKGYSSLAAAMAGLILFNVLALSVLRIGLAERLIQAVKAGIFGLAYVIPAVELQRLIYGPGLVMEGGIWEMVELAGRLLVLVALPTLTAFVMLVASAQTTSPAYRRRPPI